MATSCRLLKGAATLRRSRVIMVAAAGALLLALAAVHAAPVRALVLRHVASVLRASYGIDVRAASLSYNVLTLSAELRGVELAFVDTPSEPFAAADVLGVTFSARILVGDVNLQRISLVAPRIDIRRHADGSDNLPRVSGAQSAGAGFVLPPIAVDDLDVSFQQPDISAVIHGASVQLTSAESGKVSAAINAQHGLRMTVSDRTIVVDNVAGAFDIEGQQLYIRDLTVTRPGTAFRANGRIAFRDDASSIDVSVTGSSAIESWWAEFSDQAGPVGHVKGTAHVTGLLSEPTITFESNGRSLAWSGVQVSTMRTIGGYGSGQLSLNRVTLDIAGGTVEGHGTIAVADTRRPSRIDARWAEVDARRIPGADRLGGTLAKSGTAIVEWRREAASASPLFSIIATTGLVASGRTTAIDVRASGHADRWHIDVAPRDTSALDLRAAADIRLDSRRWEASAIDGRVVMRTIDLPSAIRQAQAFGAAASIDPATAAGVIELDATLEGTLAAVRSSGRITGRSVTLAGLPSSDLDVSFGVDVTGKTSTGTFRLLAPALVSSTLASQSGMVLGGSLTATGSWSGPLIAPIVDASLAGRDLTVARGGSAAVTVTGGALDATVKGPIGDLGGEGTLTIGSLQVGGRNAGDVSADLALAAGIVRIRARAPKVNAALAASIGLGAPNAFDGQGTVVDYDIQQFGELVGLPGADASALRGTISSSISFKGDLRNATSLAVELDVSPLDARVFDVPIALERGLRATMTGGRLEIDDRTMTIGGVVVRAHGALETDRPEGKLVSRSGWGHRHAPAVAPSHRSDERLSRSRRDHWSCRDRTLRSGTRGHRQSQGDTLNAREHRQTTGTGRGRGN